MALTVKFLSGKNAEPHYWRVNDGPGNSLLSSGPPFTNMV